MSDKFAVLDIKPIHKWPWPRILVGIPVPESIPHAGYVFMNFMTIAAQGPAFIDVPPNIRIDVVRHTMAKTLLQNDYTHLLMLDIDHQHPLDIIQRFARRVIEDPTRRIISGLNFRRRPPHDPVGGYLDDKGRRVLIENWGTDLIPVDECGAASLLIERSVFEELEPPWFFNIYDDIWRDNWPGEDIGFSRKAKQAGIDVWIDPTIQSPHCTTSFVVEETWLNSQAKIQIPGQEVKQEQAQKQEVPA